ncbi:MAG TPA: hypothetical protein DCE71_03020 [Parachlamydiales bacterium]|nr:hypothetical protein [Parachlamydiales bacterium]
MKYIEDTFKEINSFAVNHIIPESESYRIAFIVGLAALAILGPTAITLAGGLLLGCLFSPPTIVVAASLIYVATKEKSEEKKLDKAPKEIASDFTEDTNSKSLFFIAPPSSPPEDPQELRVNLHPGDPLIALREQALKGTFNYTPAYE